MIFSEGSVRFLFACKDDLCKDDPLNGLDRHCIRLPADYSKYHSGYAIIPSEESYGDENSTISYLFCQRRGAYIGVMTKEGYINYRKLQ